MNVLVICKVNILKSIVRIFLYWFYLLFIDKIVNFYVGEILNFKIGFLIFGIWSCMVLVYDLINIGLIMW